MTPLLVWATFAIARSSVTNIDHRNRIVGLVTGACFAHLGHDVVCVDVDSGKIAELQAGRVPVFERGLEELVASGLASGQLAFRVGHDDRSRSGEFHFLCVPTPGDGDGGADLTCLHAAVDELRGLDLAPDTIIVNKSTVPVGSSRLVEQLLGRPDLAVVSNPEFLREGSAVDDFLQPDRIVIGGDAPEAMGRVAALYEPLNATVLLTGPASAELIKYASNAYLATRLSFINAVASICEGVGADVADVRLGMGYDRRIGLDFLQPGPGWGGSCFPKDTRALLRAAKSVGYDFALLGATIELNDRQFDQVLHRLERMLGGSVEGRTVCLLGLAFKAGTDDIRMSPAIAVADRLLAAGASIRSFDPQAQVGRPELAQQEDPYSAAAGAHAVVVLTEWPAFKRLDFARLAQTMVGSVVFDTRRILDPAVVARAGLDLAVIGQD